MSIHQNEVKFTSIFEDPKQKVVKQTGKSAGNAIQNLQGYSIKTQLLKKSKKHKKWNTKTYALYEDKLAHVMENTVDQKVIKIVSCMLIANLRLYRVMIEDDLDSKYGFQFLITSETYYELYTRSKETMNLWFNQLRKYTILSNFQLDYKIYKLLGQGSFAQVFYAKHRSRGQEFAIKQFDKSKFQDKDVERLALKKEFEIMRKLKHNNIINLYQIYEDEKFLYVIVDLLKGGDLLSNINRYGRFNEDNAKKLMLPLLKALVYLHKTHNIMHRDLKPENIILKNKNDIFDICISDFGLADYFTQIGKYLFTRCGTPGYVAPEILRDEKYDHKVDCFSVGIIMFIILTGTSPFSAEDHDVIVDKNLKCNIDFSTRNLDKRVSYDALDLLKKLLKQNPKERISAEDALKHSFFDDTQQSQNSKPKITTETSLDEVCDSIEDLPRHYHEIKAKFNLQSRTPLLTHKFETPQTTSSPQFNSKQFGQSPNSNLAKLKAADKTGGQSLESPSNQVVVEGFDKTPVKNRTNVVSLGQKDQLKDVNNNPQEEKKVDNPHSLNEMDEYDLNSDFDENPVGDNMAKYNFNQKILLNNKQRQSGTLQPPVEQSTKQTQQAEEQKTDDQEKNKIDQKKQENRANVKQLLKNMEQQKQ